MDVKLQERNVDESGSGLFIDIHRSSDYSFVKRIKLGCVSQQTCFCPIERGGFPVKPVLGDL